MCNQCFDEETQLQTHLVDVHGIEDEYLSENGNVDPFGDDTSDSLSHNGDAICQTDADYLDTKPDDVTMETSEAILPVSSSSSALSINTGGNILKEQVQLINESCETKCSKHEMYNLQF